MLKHIAFGFGAGLFLTGFGLWWWQCAESCQNSCETLTCSKVRV